jgi:hypothetical protein
MSFSLYPVVAEPPEKPTPGQGRGRSAELPQAPCVRPRNGGGQKPLLGKEELLMGGLVYLGATARIAPPERDAANCHPRTARCSGGAPAEPYPPRRLESRQSGRAPVSCQMNGGPRAV